MLLRGVMTWVPCYRATLYSDVYLVNGWRLFSGVRRRPVLPRRGSLHPSAGLLVRVAVHGTLSKGKKAGRGGEGGAEHRLSSHPRSQLRHAVRHQGKRSQGNAKQGNTTQRNAMHGNVMDIM